VAGHLGDHLRLSRIVVAGVNLAVAGDEEHVAKLDLLTGFDLHAIDPQPLAGLDAILLATGLDDGVDKPRPP
jgi:hypothetical protein